MITTTSLIFWYICIGSLVAMRIYSRIKKYIPALSKKFDSDVGDNDYEILSTEQLLTHVILLFGVLTWPAVLIWGWKLIFTERYPFKVPIEEEK